MKQTNTQGTASTSATLKLLNYWHGTCNSCTGPSALKEMSYQYFLTFPDIPGYSTQKLNHVMLKDDERAEVKGHQVPSQSFRAGNKLTGDIG